MELPLTSDANQLLAGMTDLIRPGVTSKWLTHLGRFRIDPASVRASTISVDDNSHLLVELEGEYAGQIAYPTSGLLTLSVGVDRRLVRFFNSLQGDPSQASGDWMRMLYFSSTTLTTLGLGDVTPVSSAARLWVWLEAVGGIVLIGLFLGAITAGIRRQSP